MADAANGSETDLDPKTPGVRLAMAWCRAWGDDHGSRVREWLERCVERELARRQAG